jgi:protoporphyrin/coproporphyrin ferrochelatase
MTVPIGVLVMAYGGPNSLEEIPGYLADIRSGRPTPARVVEEICNNYRQIGGKSPLLEITHRQVAALQVQFDPEHFRFYLGMRHWSPWIEDAVRDMIGDGITHALSLVLAPQYSKLSIAKYHAKIEAGLEMHRGQIEFAHIESYHDAPGLIQALANRVGEGLGRWTDEMRSTVHVIFSAHSLPVRILQMGDPYADQLHETARLVAGKAGLGEDQWSWSYQSAGRSPEPWLGPQLPEHLEMLAEKGIRDVVSVPVGFVSDHVEILYDIDIQAKQVASERGIRLERPPALNDDPLFIHTLKKVIRDRLIDTGWLNPFCNI